MSDKLSLLDEIEEQGTRLAKEFEPLADGRIGDAKLSLDVAYFAFAAQEREHEILQVRWQSEESLDRKACLDLCIAAAARETADGKLIAAERTAAHDFFLTGTGLFHARFVSVKLNFLTSQLRNSIFTLFSLVPKLRFGMQRL